MKLLVKILVRLAFLCCWFALGYYPYNDIITGFLSGAWAIILMEIFYHFDKRTSGFEKVMNKLAYLDDTLEEVQKTESLILDELMINAANVRGDSDTSKGIRQGIDLAKTIVEYRFREVSRSIHHKKGS